VSLTILIGQNWFQCGRTSIWWQCSASLVPQFLICLRVSLVLATAPGYPAAVRVGTGTVALVLFWNRQGTKPHLKPQFFGRVLHTAKPHFRELRTLAPVKYLSSDRITI
jgi:hypothetical protein